MLSNEPALNLMSTRLLCAMFDNLDRHFQQEIICDLVAKIGSGGASSTLRSTSLTTLETLAFKNTEALSNYAIFTASVLDHIESMTLDEVRRVMNVLSRLAFSKEATSSAASGLRDDLHIVVRKQISASKNAVKRMGVVGVVAVVKNMLPSKVPRSDETSTSSTSTQKSNPSYR